MRSAVTYAVGLVCGVVIGVLAGYIYGANAVNERWKEAMDEQKQRQIRMRERYR